MERSLQWALFAGLLVSPAMPAQTVSADLRGIYIYTNDVSQVSSATASQLTQSFSIQGIDGVAIVIGWNALEPSLGHYQWTVLDQWISQVSALGKKIDLVVPAGSSTPAWLFQPPPAGAGAVDLNFTVTPHAGATGVCDTVDIAAPWDTAFLAQWDALLAALSAHLKSAGTYNAITLVRLTGINRTTEELRLPAETAASTGLSCVSNSIATWQQAGYRPSLLLQGWNAIVDSFTKSFPDKSFAVSIIPNDAFPGIDQNGAAIAGTIGDENDPLIMSAAAKLPSRLVVQFDFLMPGDAAAAQVVDDSTNLGTLIAFQTNEYLGGQGAGCAEPITNTIPCTASTYMTMLNEGIYPRMQTNPLRAQYVEVFHANASAFPADIEQAHLELTCDYALNLSGQAFTAQGGSGTITITTGAGCPWGVGALPAGVSLTGASSGAGNGSVTFQVVQNSGGDLSGSFTIAEQTFTIEQSAATIAGLAAAGSLGQVASEGTWDFSLIGINLGASIATARFTFADNSGNPLALPLTFPQQPAAAGPELASTLDRTLSPNAQILMDSTGPDNVATLVGSGQLLSNGNVSGFGIFSNPKAHWNAVAPLETRNASRYTLAFDNTGPLTTGVAVASLAAQGTNVPVIIRDDTGTQIGNPTIRLSALGHTSFMLNDPQLGFPVTNNKRGTIEFDTPPGGQLSVLGLRANGSALTTLPVLANVGASGGSITHVAYNGGWTSAFYIVNTGNASAQFTLNFFDENGAALAAPLLLPQSETTITTSGLTRTLVAGAMLVVDTQAQDAQTLVIGSAQLTTTGNISGFEVFRWTSFGQEASVPLETRTPNSFVLVYDNTNQLVTGLALANQASLQATILVHLRDDAGSLLQTTSVTLPARGHTSFLFNDTTQNFTITNGRRGTAEFIVPNGGKISVIGLRAKSDGTLTTIPVMIK